MISKVLCVILAIIIIQILHKPYDDEDEVLKQYEEAEYEFFIQAEKETKARIEEINNLIKYMKYEIDKSKNLLMEVNTNLEKSYNESEQTNILLNRILAQLKIK